MRFQIHYFVSKFLKSEKLPCKPHSHIRNIDSRFQRISDLIYKYILNRRKDMRWSLLHTHATLQSRIRHCFSIKRLLNKENTLPLAKSLKNRFSSTFLPRKASSFHIKKEKRNRVFLQSHFQNGKSSSWRSIEGSVGPRCPSSRQASSRSRVSTCNHSLGATTMWSRIDPERRIFTSRRLVSLAQILRRGTKAKRGLPAWIPRDGIFFLPFSWIR